MKNNTIILIISILGFVCILINVFNRNLFDGHFTTLGVVLIAIPFFYRRLNTKEDVDSKTGIKANMKVLFGIKDILMIILFLIMGLIYFFYVKS